MFKLPFYDSPDFEYSTTLSGVEYIFKIIWNSFGDSWYLTLKDYSGNILVDGIRLVTLTDLLGQYQMLNTRPEGFLICLQVNQDIPSVSPTRYSFRDGTHSLVYITNEELNEIITQI